MNEAINAADILANTGVEATIVDMHTIKPLDSDLIIKLANE